MLVTVLAFKSLKKSDEPKTIYLGHDRKEAFKMEVPEGYARTEVHLLAQPFKRKISSTYRKEQAAAADLKQAEEAAHQENKEKEKAKPQKPAAPVASDGQSPKEALPADLPDEKVPDLMDLAANTSPEPAPEAKAPAKPKPEKPAPKGK